jgi:hypothetical protein
VNDDPKRRSDETEDDRRRGDRRRSQLSIFIERRLGDRRRIPRRLIDSFRAFLGLPPFDRPGS